MKKNKIPVIFAVTGHRDICKKAIPQIKKILKNTFESFQKKYPHTPMILISALAEGADMLVAEVAIECGVELHIMLPYQEEVYLKSFKDSENIKIFNKLKSKASKIEVISNIDKYSAEKAYEMLGKKLADLSTILIALWDGKYSGEKGGTSEVIKYKEKIFAKNSRDFNTGSSIYIISTPRKNSIYTKEMVKLEKHYIGLHINKKEFEKIIKKIDTLNLEIEKNKENSLTYLHSLMKFFEKKASENQKKFKLYSKLLLGVSAISIISLEFFHDFGVDISLMFYGIGIIIAFFIYYFLIKKGTIQNNFVYSRGFVEAIRVQNIWNAININRSVADYYLTNQHHKYLWIKISLRNMTYIDKTPFNPIANDKKFMPEYWINEQIEYYKNAIINRGKSYNLWEKTEKLFYKTGLLFLILMFLYFFSEDLFELHTHFLHVFIFVSSISLLIAVLIGEQYNKIEGFEEDIYNFEIMYNLFLNTKKSLNNFPENSDEYKKIIKNLGVAALDENTKWLVSHDRHKVKPILE